MAASSLFDKLMAGLGTLHARRVARQFLHAVRRSVTTQENLLREILARAEGSDFARDHRLDRCRSYEDFAARLPVRGYDVFAPYLERVRMGRTQALFPPDESILMFALTSGTTDRPKYIPVTRRVLADTRAGWNIWGVKALLDHRDCFLRHIVQVTSDMNDHAAPSGVPCGAITGLLAATQKRLVRKYYTSPLALSRIKDAAAKYYTIMRLAIPKDVAWMVTANPATLLALARIADERRERIIRDLHDGTLDADLPVPGDIRAALAGRLTPEPCRARELEAIVTKAGALAPKDYWRLGFVAHWTGGTMGLYRSQFPAWFGEAPSRDIGLIASEGRMSIPLEDGTSAGVLAVTSQFFEFIPAQEYGREGARTFRSHEVSVGEEYFLVLTNFSGLYRYDLGDRVRITGRLADAPVIEFLSRDAHTSSLTGEKLTEHQVVEAVRRVRREDDGVLADFVLAPRWAEIPFYRLYVDRPIAVADFARRLDVALCDINLEYASKRESLRLGPIEVVVLPPGELTRRDLALKQARGPTTEQFKHQYLLVKPGSDADLEKAVKTPRTTAHDPVC